MTKKQLLLNWCRQTRLFSTVNVRDFGAQNQFLRAERCCRELCNEGLIRRIPDEEIILRGLRRGKATIGFWEVC